MPRGRHRHSPPLHRLLPPSAIAGVSVVCAFGPWVFTEAALLRVLAAAAAGTAVVGAVVMRRWDMQAGKQVADLTRARASDEWRHEERVAELESDLEESRELRGKLEQRLRAKRAELAKLRNEHAALLRRYATAETERASALEGRRLLEIGSGAPTRAALPPVPVPRRGETETPAAEGAEPTLPADADADHARGDEPDAPAVFSPGGAELFVRANAALSRLAGGAGGAAGAAGAGDAADAGDAQTGEAVGGTDRAGDAGTEAAAEDEARGKSAAAAGHERAAADPHTEQDMSRAQSKAPASAAPGSAAPHFAVPTAVAVVPPAPARRPAIEGGFDFFGTKKPAPAALEAVQNEDLADVVGQEALDLHKAEAEARFRPAGAQTRAVGQVIDLTAHDETEQIDVQGLRSAAS
ncbi:hypothetical protein [Streptomyces sp. enrichment culture]|uniref:hypothetical protein n=1 Tax=Streptomyces sp. enrichment culture TaxID=1795815 RepID=UPI003F54E9F9